MSVLQQYFLDVAMITWLFMTMIFIFALIKKDNSIVDIFWGLGFLVIAGYSMIQSGELDLRKIIVNFLLVIWGLRLSFHIYLRNAGKEEDFRYKAWRKKWKLFYLRSYFQIFMLQGLIMLVVASPIWFINFSSSGPLGLWDFLGLVTFGAGFLMEVLSDSELAEFRKKTSNKGKLLTTGAWSISRHPNYFGEALLWWGFGLYTLSLPGGWMTLVSPVVMTLLLRFVSGVPMLEEKLRSHPDWESYKTKTAPFVPFLHRF